MKWTPGESGNPKGRPPKPRALTSILETELSKTMETPDGTRMAKKRFIAQRVTELLTTGQVTFPDGRVLACGDVDEYTRAVTFMYKHIDGDKQTLDVTSNGQNIVTRIEVVAPAAEADPAVSS